MATIFEKIIAREIPAHIVYEDEKTIAFLDISQATKGHTLVVPKKAYPNIYEMDTNILKEVIAVTQKIAVAVKDAFHASGVNILSNNDEIAGQTVFHFHFHVIPRYAKDDVKFQFTNFMGSISHEEYKERAHLIKAALS
ncbi:MAG: diadenosine tetraphosphate hydrolase [Tenericutes bacterium HGW-Tenericutes-6]|jgi:histidine triad (HIT) family protein|nr:MAG: diadenosine tetraphosphate hydrolase [Tenericutes bacterium HGW-Tenericutes-6]